MSKQNLARFCFAILIVFNSQPNLFAQPKKASLDSLVNLLPQIKETKADTNKVNFYNNLSFQFRLYSNNPQKAVDFAESAQTIAHNLHYEQGEATAWHNKGLAYFNESKFFEALECHEYALALRTQIGDKRGISRSLTAKGIALQQQGNLDLALEAFFQSVKIAEEIKDTVSMAVVYFSIGNVYSKQQKLEKSLIFQQKGLSLHRTTNINTNVAYSLIGIGATFFALKRYEEALASYKEALLIHTNNNFPLGIAAALNEIGKIYFLRADYISAENTQNKALEIQESIGDKNGMAVSNAELAKISQKLHKPYKTLIFAQTAFAIAREIGAKSLIYENGVFLANMYKDEKRSDEALSVLNIAMSAKDSIFNEQKAAKIVELETKFELKAKQKEIELLAKDNELKTIVRNSLASGIVILLGFVILILIRYRDKQRANAEILRQQTLLEEQAREIELINGELQQANDSLNEKNSQLLTLNNEKNEFLGIAAHDLKNPLGSIKLLTAVINEHSKKVGDSNVSNWSELILNTTEQMLEMTTNLLDINAIEQGTVHLELHALNCSHLLREVIQAHNYRAESKNIKLHYSPPSKSIFAKADENAFLQVIDNLLSNAIKYSPLGKNIYIGIDTASSDDSIKKNIVKISIQDEGQGLTNEDKQKIFGKFARLSAQPTGGEHSTGLGLSIVKRMVERMNGSVYCVSDYGNGATFIVELPLAEAEY